MNKDIKTLIIFTPGFPANEADSTCMPFPQLFVKTLKKLHPALNVIVIAFQYPFTASEYKWHDVEVIAFNGQNRGGIRRLLLWRTVLKRTAIIVRENNVIGILNFWLGECGLIGKYAAKKYALSYFTWLLGQDARKNNRYFSLIKPEAQNLVALSDFLAEEFYRNYKITPVHIIPPGIDVSSATESPVEKNIDILGAGSLIPLKQYEIFIRVVAKLAVDKPTIKTIICGKGPEQAYLQKLIDDANLAANVLLYGEIEHSRVLALMGRAKVFLHPSSYEGFATVYQEALYAGAQVVGFCMPMSTIFKNQHVVNTEEEMVCKVKSLLTDARSRHEKILTFSIEQTCRKISALYKI